MAAKKTKKRPKKKPMRKTKKKVARRKPRPKAGLAKSGWSPKEFTIVLLANDQGADSQPSTKRSRRDLVRWVNQSSVSRTLRFKNGLWPFEGNRCDIVVPLGGETGWYRIERRANESGKIVYAYVSDPPFAPGGPPGDPVVDAGD